MHSICQALFTYLIYINVILIITLKQLSPLYRKRNKVINIYPRNSWVIFSWEFIARKHNFPSSKLD